MRQFEVRHQDTLASGTTSRRWRSLAEDFHDQLIALAAHIRQMNALRGKAYTCGPHGLNQGCLAGDRLLVLVEEDVLDGG